MCSVSSYWLLRGWGTRLVPTDFTRSLSKGLEFSVLDLAVFIEEICDWRAANCCWSFSTSDWEVGWAIADWGLAIEKTSKQKAAKQVLRRREFWNKSRVVVWPRKWVCILFSLILTYALARTSCSISKTAFAIRMPIKLYLEKKACFKPFKTPVGQICAISRHVFCESCFTIPHRSRWLDFCALRDSQYT